MKKTFKAVAASVLAIALLAMPVMADTRGIGWIDNGDGRWWYSLRSNGSDWYRGETGQVKWAWIDGNHDGLAECYCFDDGGWLIMNGTTPDGYTVNANGAWTVNGVVQQRSPHIYSGS